MKYLVIVITVLISYNGNVRAYNWLDAASEAFRSFATTITKVYSNIKAFFSSSSEPYESPFEEQLELMGEQRVRQAFNDFVEDVAAESDVQNPEYLVFKGEPTALMSTPQLATLHGYRVESHVVQTKDGYYLTLHRKLNVFQPNTTKLTNQTVLLHHGLLGSSADWILLGPAKSLPYMLANAGCDVWLTNARGNYYSRRHVSKKIESLDFWKFSWHEMGVYDLPAVIDYIKDLKNSSEPINYVGHSIGATALLVLLSTHTQYNSQLRMGILLAPLALLENVKGPLKVLTPFLVKPPKYLLRSIGNGEFIPSRKVPKGLSEKYCIGRKVYCNNPLFFLSGGITQLTWDASFAARVLYHVPAGGSTNTLLHYAQVLNNRRFHEFGDKTAQYNLTAVTLPIALFSSTDDSLANMTDVLRLFSTISNPIEYQVIQNKNVSHTDFVWGFDANSLVFDKIIDCLQNDVLVIKANEV